MGIWLQRKSRIGFIRVSHTVQYGTDESTAKVRTRNVEELSCFKPVGIWGSLSGNQHNSLTELLGARGQLFVSYVVANMILNKCVCLSIKNRLPSESPVYCGTTYLSLGYFGSQVSQVSTHRMATMPGLSFGSRLGGGFVTRQLPDNIDLRVPIFFSLCEVRCLG